MKKHSNKHNTKQRNTEQAQKKIITQKQHSFIWKILWKASSAWKI